MTDTQKAITNTEKDLNSASQTGFFQISTVAKNRVEDKRKRKGLGDLKKRENDVYKQIFQGGIVLGVSNTLVAPIERCRIIL